MSEPCRSRRGEGYEACDDDKQDKSVASFAAPPTTSARSAGSLRGTGVGSQAERKAQIEVAHRPNPVAVRN